MDESITGSGNPHRTSESSSGGKSTRSMCSLQFSSPARGEFNPALRSVPAALLLRRPVELARSSSILSRSLVREEERSFAQVIAKVLSLFWEFLNEFPLTLLTTVEYLKHALLTFYWKTCRKSGWLQCARIEWSSVKKQNRPSPVESLRPPFRFLSIRSECFSPYSTSPRSFIYLTQYLRLVAETSNPPSAFPGSYPRSDPRSNGWPPGRPSASFSQTFRTWLRALSRRNRRIRAQTAFHQKGTSVTFYSHLTASRMASDGSDIGLCWWRHICAVHIHKEPEASRPDG